MFVLQNAPREALELPGLVLEPLHIDKGTTQFDLTLFMSETEQGLAGALEYSTDLFDAATIERMIGHFQRLLEGVVADPEMPIGDLPLLTEAEKRLLLEEWNDTRTVYPGSQCIHQLFEAQVERTPDAVAVAAPSPVGSEPGDYLYLTYQELNHKANQLGYYLQSLGVGPGVLVGLCVERSFEMVVGLLGILKAGGAYVPIDPAYPRGRVALMLEDAQVAVLLTQSQLREGLPVADSAQVVCLDTDWEAISEMPGSNLGRIATSDHVAYTIYTSGSTGRPKGVQVLHRGVVNFLCSMRDRPGRGRRMSCWP
jgi:non-ribosomal peptide synthetase component F